ncbi:MAG: hypothetical protein ACFHHU_18800 [Porticoccaceae bacterium]
MSLWQKPRAIVRVHSSQLQDVYLDRCKINAPYDGVMVEWRSQPYQIANPGDAAC